MADQQLDVVVAATARAPPRQPSPGADRNATRRPERVQLIREPLHTASAVH